MTYEVYVFNGKSWNKFGEYGAFSGAQVAAKKASKGDDRAADITKDGVKLAHYRNGERTQ